MMDCQHYTEKLPWLRNGSLSAPEAQTVQNHLEQCSICQNNWQEILEAEAVFSAHVDSGLLVDLAHGDAEAEPWIRDHLKRCSSCAEELAWVRGEIETLPQTKPASWKRYSIAATFTIALLGGVLWNQIPSSPSSGSTEMVETETTSFEVQDEVLFADGFESGNVSSWSTTSL